MKGGALFREETPFSCCQIAKHQGQPSQTEKQAVMQKSNATLKTTPLEDIHAVSPALDKYTQDRLLGDLWKRPGLSPRNPVLGNRLSILTQPKI
jgi:hypothetical protein